MKKLLFGFALAMIVFNLSAQEDADTTNLELLFVQNADKISYSDGQLTLKCGYNRLTKLDVSNNSSLESLGCYGNQLTSLDISKNTALGYLYCFDNQLTSLVMSDSYNFELYDLDCSENQLSSLDISNYRQLDFLHIRSMPSLFEVCVWYNPISPPLTFKIDKTGSPNVYFTNDCSQ